MKSSFLLLQLIATTDFVDIRVPRMRLSCRGHLTRTVGRDGAETHGEDQREWGIGGKARIVPSIFKPMCRRAVSSGRAARQMRRGSWSRVAQIGYDDAYGTVYVESR